MAHPNLEFAANCETLIDLVKERSRNDGDKVGYEFWEAGKSLTKKLTYKELDRHARKIAAALQDRDLQGERVLLFYFPGIDYITAFFGCLYAGVIAVPTYPPRRSRTVKQIQSIAANSSTKLVLTTETIRSQFNERLGRGMLSQIEWLATDVEVLSTTEWCEPKIGANTLAFLQYTSGSTANPKGAMVSHHNILQNLELIFRCFNHNQNSRGVIWLPPYHDMGLIGGILQPLYGMFPVALMSPVNFLQNPLSWLRLVSHYRGTTSGGPNFAYQLCVEKAKHKDLTGLDLSSWKVAFNGSEPIRAETLQQFSETFAPYGFDPKAFYPCYGIAESTLIVTGGRQDTLAVIRHWDKSGLETGKAQPVSEYHAVDQTSSLVSSGYSQMNHKVIVVDPETFCRCSARTIGEIWIAGTSVTQGYWNGPRKTVQNFRAYLAEGTAGPFLRTGDLGFLDHDNELFVVARLKDLIIIRGQKYYPLAIETTVGESHYALRSGHGAAISVDVNGMERLVVIQEVKRSVLRYLNISEVTNAVRRVVMQHHQISPYAIVLIKTGSLPKTSSGKIKRYACRKDFCENRLVVVGDWAETPAVQSKFRALKSEVDAILKPIAEGTLSIRG